MPHFALGYAVGLIVGEGCFSHDGRTPALSVKLHARDTAPLEHLQRVFGGRIYGPYESRGRRYCVWHLRGPGLVAALHVLDRSLPASHKREQFLVWRARHFPIVDVAARFVARWSLDPP
jgi:hypothetical protein